MTTHVNEPVFGNKWKEIAQNLETEIFLASKKKRSFTHNEPPFFAIALSGEFGVGKSTFLHLFKKTIESGAHFIKDETNGELTNSTIYLDRGSNSRLYENKKVKLIYFNAFKYDFSDDPLTALISVLIKKYPEKYVDFINKLPAIARVASGALKILSPIHPALIPIAAGIDSAVDGTEKLLSNQNIYSDKLKDFLEFDKNIDLLKNELANLESAETLKIIIIDELDRCKPTFALNLLEIVKHVFSAENCIFLFGVNKKALISTIQSIYGNTYPADEYLNRFFYSTKIFTINAALDMKRDIFKKYVDPNFPFVLLNYLTDLLPLRESLIIYDALENYSTFFENGARFPVLLLAIKIHNPNAYEQLKKLSLLTDNETSNIKDFENFIKIILDSFNINLKNCNSIELLSAITEAYIINYIAHNKTFSDALLSTLTEIVRTWHKNNHSDSSSLENSFHNLNGHIHHYINGRPNIDHHEIFKEIDLI